MWIFSHKEEFNGVFEQHKVRLLGDGKTQKVGIDCGETFCPVVKPATIRIFISLSLSKAWPIHQLDVKMLFFMVSYKNQYICINLWNIEIGIIRIMYLFCVSTYMV